MAEEKKSSNSKVIIILLIIVIVLLIGGGVTAFVLLSNNQSTNNTITETGNTALNAEETQQSKRQLTYDAAVVALDEDSLQKAVDEAFSKTEDGYITLDFSSECKSIDGQNFECALGNSPENKRDMYIGIYLDNNFEEEYYLSGLIRPGEMIQHFQGTKVLENGVYEVVATMTQVEDDHETMSYSTSVVLTLIVDKTDR